MSKCKEIETQLNITKENKLAPIQARFTKSSCWVGPETTNGWIDIIVELDKKIAEIAPDYKIAQIKSKFGGLRYYLFTLPSGVEKLIDEAELKASKTCEFCGRPGKLCNISRWNWTLCEERYEEKSKGREAYWYDDN